MSASVFNLFRKESELELPAPITMTTTPPPTYEAACAPPALSADPERQAMRALPANWYTSPEMYELERRAIFSKSWMLITHKARLTEAGKWLRYDVAGYQFVICRDRQGNINAFHNVCRHRAFPVVLGDEGKNQIFSCKYHGWSYGLNGKLAKAPGYQELEGFDKSANNLFPIHLHIDCNGFIWVNLDGKKVPSVSWEEDWKGIDTQERYKVYNFDDYEFDHVWWQDGAYNWKILADNYNECYHCATAHPDISALANLQSYSVNVDGGKIIHNPATTEEQRKNGLTIASTYYFPNVSTNVSPHFFMVQRFVPDGPTKSSMRYEVFKNKHSTEEQFQLVNQIYKRIMAEDKYLCDLAQKNLNAGVFINGEMHPRLEKGPLHFQKNVRDAVTSHFAQEQEAKHEIWPARQQIPSTATASKQDIEFCAGLPSCQTNQQSEVLAW